MSLMNPDKIAPALNLPNQVPWMGYDEPGFLGSGVIGCTFSTKGVWSSLMGPAYSMNSYLRKERLKAFINGKQYILDGEMHRAEQTGVFYSINYCGEAIVYVIDFAPMHTPYACRILAVQNTTDQDILFRPYAEIKYKSDTTREGKNNLLNINLYDQYTLSMKFIGLHTNIRIFEEEDEIVLDTENQKIKAYDISYTTLCHYTYSGRLPVVEATAFIDTIDSLTDLQSCIADWQGWMKKGKDLSFISDERARQVIQSTVAFIRMEQGENGGVMSNPGGYSRSYVRDNHSSMRGMLAAGYTEEAKKYLFYMHAEYEKLVTSNQFGIPTANPIGGIDPPFLGFGNQENWSCETPGLYVLTAKRYLEETNDLSSISAIQDSLKYAVDVQINFAKKHDWKLIFNGDETESGGCGITLAESITVKNNKYSMPSLVICIAATEFYIDFLKKTNRTEEVFELEHSLSLLKKSLDDTYWDEELGIYHWFLSYQNEWPKTRMVSFQIMPLYFGNITSSERAKRCALAMKEYIMESGLVPNQPLGENNDFCGHIPGYLLYALTELGDPLKDKVYDALINSGIVGCWGMWSEAYYSDGTPYGYGQNWDDRLHNLRPFESGTNIEAIIKYWEDKQQISEG